MTSELTVTRYRDQALQLLPFGRALSREIDGGIAKILEAMAVEFARVDELAAAFLRNIIPSKADEMADEWEAALGLPGDCVETPSVVLSERRGAIVTKLRGRTEHDVGAYDQAATDLGFDPPEYVTRESLRAGTMAAGDRCWGDDYASYVHVIVPFSDQTSDTQLECIYVDVLRRSHGFVDVLFEGPLVDGEAI